MKRTARCSALILAALAIISVQSTQDAMDEDAEDAAAYARYMAATEASAQLMRHPVKSIYRSSMVPAAAASKGRMVHVWSAWTVWSTCSRTCGGGISSRHRTCRKEYSRISPGSGIRTSFNGRTCVGEPTEYTVCNPQPCPAADVGTGQEDFRLYQCALYNNRTLRGHLVASWTPYQLGSNQCELSCRAGSRAPALVHTFGKVLDGTRCTTSPEEPYRDFCINGRCLAVGCDGRVGSMAKLDMCSVCKGDNSTCVKVAAMAFPNPDDFVLRTRNPQRLTETYGYSSLVRIPRGATHIRLGDNSSNYIALMDETGRYFLNGNWIIDWPGRYEPESQAGQPSSAGGGTAFNYERIRDAETVQARGPLREDLVVMVLVREKDAGVYYEYWIPRHQASIPPSSSSNLPVTSFHQPGQRLVSARPTTTTTTTPRSATTTARFIRRTTTTAPKIVVQYEGNRSLTTETPDWQDDDDYEPQPTAASLIRAPPRVMSYREIFGPFFLSSAEAATTPAPVTTTTATRMTTTQRPTMKKKKSKVNQVRQHLGLVHTHKSDKKLSNSIKSVVKSGPEGSGHYNHLHGKKKPCSVDGSCWKTVNGKKHFCLSDFVLRCRVLNYETINGETRYEVQVIQSYKNMIPILNKEFIWAEPVKDCPCPAPYLRTGTDYIIMGKTDRGFGRRNEVRLLLDSESYVRVYNQANAERVLRIRRDEAKYCQKFKTTFNLTT